MAITSASQGNADQLADRRQARHTEKEFDGPLAKRSCTDVIFFIIFLAFLGGLGYGLYYSVIRGNIERILIGYDNHGNICGRRNPPLINITSSGQDMTNKPYLVFELGNQLPGVPLATGGTIFNLGVKSRHCDSQCPPNAPDVFLHRCIPANATSQLATSFLQDTGLTNFFDKASMDIQLCWKEIVYLCLIALGLSIVMTILFRFLAGLVVWVLLIALILGSMAGTAYLWVTWYYMNQDFKAMEYSSQADTEVRNMMIYAIVLSVVTVLIALIVLVMRKRVELVVQLFHEAGKAIHSMPLLLIQPIWTLIAVCALCFGWIWGALWIESAGNATPDASGFVIFSKDTFLQVMRWYNLFAVLWLTQFCFACQHLIVAGAVATWFFSRNKSHLGLPIITSIGRLIRYHLGSVALGSFIIALLKLVRFIMSYIERQLKSRGLNNSIFSFLIKCCQCCLLCFERFIKYLNTNAYIEIAIYGKNFCSSAQRAFGLLSSNVLRVAAINSVGDFVLFLGKAGVVTSIVFIGIEFMKTKPGVNYIWVPILIAAIFAYAIAHCFISIYEMTIDAVFLCFCEDCEMNDGLEKPYFMSRGLMEFVENSGKALQAYDQRKRQNKRAAKANPYDNPAGPTADNVWTTDGKAHHHVKPTAPPAS